MKSLQNIVMSTRAFAFTFTVLTLMSVTEIASASDTPGSAAAQDFVDDLNRVILFPLIALLMGVAFLVFLIGCAEYVMGASNPSAREKGVRHITYGVIGLVVMISAWAILSLATATFGFSL